MRWAIAASAVLLSANWGIYIWAVNAGHIVEASLGYFINPLINVLFGYAFLGERLRRMAGRDALRDRQAPFALGEIGNPHCVAIHRTGVHRRHVERRNHVDSQHAVQRR